MLRPFIPLLLIVAVASSNLCLAGPLNLKDGDKVTLVGGTFIEREAESSYIETYLSLAYPDADITFRNLGWSADTVRAESRGYFKPEQGYKELLDKTADTKPTVVVLAYGASEAWAGPAGLDAFITDYTTLIQDLKERTSARIILMSTPRQEDKGEPFPDPQAYNRNLKLYFEAVGKLAEEKGLEFVDIFTQLKSVNGLTSNSIHLNDEGYMRVAKLVADIQPAAADDILVHIDSKSIKSARGHANAQLVKSDEVRFTYRPQRLGDMTSGRSLNILGLAVGDYEVRANGRVLLVADDDELAQGVSGARLLANEQLLRETIKEKNEQYFYSWRPQNTTYLFGFRKHEQGKNNKELAEFGPFVEEYESKIAQLKKPTTVEWSVSLRQPEAPRPIEHQPESTVLPPDKEVNTFNLPDDLEVSLFASEPMIVNPTHMNWDEDGRLWVACAPDYPQIKPGHLAQDQIVVLVDEDKDGRADTHHVFVDDALLPTAVLPGNGGVYVGNSTELVFYRDLDGDMKADEKQIILSGFGTEDTHHIIHTLYWGQDGMMYFNQSIYIHSHVETPWGVERLMAGGIWQFNPHTHKLRVMTRGLINTWGHRMDRYGRSFATDGAGSSGINYVFPGVAQRTAYGTRHMYPGLNPGQPKICGLEIISGSHFPEKYQGLMVGNDFRGHRTVSFRVKKLGSGFVSTQQDDIIAAGSGKMDRKGSGGGFRPIDVKMGPDGALYLADWSNLIIQHGEVDFRDPRRDRSHGRIWRITARGRQTDEVKEWSEASIDQLLNNLSSKSQYLVDASKRVLIERSRDTKVMTAVDKWAKSDRTDYEKLQVMWLKSGMNAPDQSLIEELLAAKDHSVRAAAVRATELNLSGSPKLLDYYRQSIADDHALVRMETILALKSVGTVEAVEVALNALDKEVDSTIEYALTYILRDLAPVWIGKTEFGGNIKHLLYAARASNDPAAVDTIYAAYKKGKLDSGDQVLALEIISEMGGDSQLSALYGQLFDKSVPTTTKSVIIDGLVHASKHRRKVPGGDHARLAQLLNTELHDGALMLIGQWKVQGLADKVTKLAKSGDRVAIDAIASLAPKDGKQTLVSIVKESPSPQAESSALVALARLDLKTAVTVAVERYQSPGKGTDYSSVFDAILRQKKGATLLQKSLAGKTIDGGIALVGVQRANMIGLKAPGLMKALNKAGNLKPMKQQLSKAEMATMVKAVEAEGNPHLGEAIYRKPALACMTCHSIGGGGSEIGPDLISIGASAPVDYLVTSLLNPSDKIKEGYHLTTVELKNGDVYAGSELSANKQEVVIRTAAGTQHVIDRKDIKKRSVSPASMMPPGLTASLSEKEFVHLVSFLSQLGKEGGFKRSSKPMIRAFKVLDDWQNDYWKDVGGQAWRPGYARVNGSIPLKDGSVFSSSRPAMKVEVDVRKPGLITLQLSNWDNVRAYTGNKEWVAIDKETGRLQFLVDKHNDSLVMLLNINTSATELSIDVVDEDSTAVFKFK